MVFIWIPVAIIVVAILTLIIKRSFWLAMCAFLISPLALTIYWVQTSFQPTLFQYAKVYSVCFGALFIYCFRYYDWNKYSWAQILGYLILFVNILEAMITEIFQGSFLNVTAGTLILLCQARPNLIGTKKNNLIYDLGLPWILAYTLWNFTFVYGRNPSTAFAICHLAVPLILMRGKAQYYIQYRAYSLAIFMLIRISLPYEPFIFLVPNWYHPHIAFTLQCMSLLFSVGLVIIFFLQGKAEIQSKNLIQYLSKKINR